MLYQAVKNCDLAATLKSGDKYRPFPCYRDRQAWESLPDEIKSYYAGAALGLNQAELLKPLHAVRYMDFIRNGNRERYQNVYFPRRSNLIALTLAECIAGGGAHIDTIIDLVWAICEETSWVVPAHNNQSGTPERMLPDIEAPVYIDLFAAETGSTLTWVYYFLGDELAKRSPLIKRRIELEVKRRILDPFLNDHSQWWKGLETDRPVNNWNPWINSNVLAAFLVMEKDETRRRDGVLLSAKSAQRFLDIYFPDGGCDEGPGYFGVAGASLFDYLEEIGYATDGAVSIYAEPLIANMARYIYRVHAGGSYFVNFADAAARVYVSAGLLERVGRAIGDPALERFARYMTANGYANKPYIGTYSTLYRLLSSVFGYRAVRPEDTSYVAPQDHMFEGIQVMTARQKADSNEGIFVAFKGGHNAESHNHNDVGSYIIYKDGKPAVIDAGVETYTRETFSEARYSIWTMRSDHHNLTDLNGYTQRPGRDAMARDVSYTADGVVTTMSMDIADAYPAQAGVLSYLRSLRFDRSRQSVTVSDAFELSRADVPAVSYVMCLCRPAAAGAGCFDLSGVRLTYDATRFDADIDEMPLTDHKIAGDWGRGELYRIRFTARKAEMKSAFSLEYSLWDG